LRYVDRVPRRQRFVLLALRSLFLTNLCRALAATIPAPGAPPESFASVDHLPKNFLSRLGSGSLAFRVPDKAGLTRTINTNRALMVIADTVKKSIDTIWPIWLCRKVLQVWQGGRVSLRRMRDTVRSEMAMPSILSSP